jgi:hypothetical protein
VPNWEELGAQAFLTVFGRARGQELGSLRSRARGSGQGRRTGADTGKRKRVEQTDVKRMV